MRSYATFAFLAALSLLVSACAHPNSQTPTINSAAAAIERQEQLKLATRQALEDGNRLTRIGLRLETAATAFCSKKLRSAIGVAYLNSEAQSEATQAILAIYPNAVPGSAYLTYVDPELPAGRAGLMAGDIIASVNGAPVTAGTIESELGKYHNGDEINIHASRGGREMDVRLRPVEICGYPFHLEQNQIINAAADGKSVHVNTGLMRFARSDEELATVLGHELAHNFRGHIDAKENNALGGIILGAVLDGLALAVGVNTGGAFSKAGGNAGTLAYSVDFEREADYVGLYVVARAGYTIENAPNLWRRMAVENPNSITMVVTHPATPERFLGLVATIKEIRAKQATHQPLVPNEKRSST